MESDKATAVAPHDWQHPMAVYTATCAQGDSKHDQARQKVCQVLLLLFCCLMHCCMYGGADVLCLFTRRRCVCLCMPYSEVPLGKQAHGQLKMCGLCNHSCHSCFMHACLSGSIFPPLGKFPACLFPTFDMRWCCFVLCFAFNARCSYILPRRRHRQCRCWMVALCLPDAFSSVHTVAQT